jgi:hypothetical protein
VDVTPQRLKHWSSQFKRLTQAKQVVPCDWDHADSVSDLQPLTMDGYAKRRSAKNTVGKLVDMALAADGQSATLTIDVPDNAAAAKAKDNLVYVSPVILPKWKDGAGNQYEDVITHIDFVNHPVDHSQGPFVPSEPGAVACAIRMGLSKPYRMAGDAAVDDDKKDDDAPKAPEADTETKDEPVADDGRLKDVIGSLANMQIVLSDDTTAENFLEHLHQALLTAAAHSGDDIAPETPSGDSPVTVADPGPTALSLEQRGAIAWAQETHQKQVASRLRQLLDDGKCTPAEFKTRGNSVGAVRLSLDKSGKPAASELEKWIESREAVPRGTFWDAESKLRMAASVAEPPSNMTGQMSDEEANRLAGWALGRK